jgi:hypothetical protein
MEKLKAIKLYLTESLSPILVDQSRKPDNVEYSNNISNEFNQLYKTVSNS